MHYLLNFIAADYFLHKRITKRIITATTVDYYNMDVNYNTPQFTIEALIDHRESHMASSRQESEHYYEPDEYNPKDVM